jgi:hypothetical protein
MSVLKREVSPPAAVSFLGGLELETNMLLKPKNWAVFQHYKDRCPPWIKLHRDLLNDRKFMRLPIASKAIAPLLWLLASESKDGVFDGSLDELVFRLHITPKEYQDGVKPLIDNQFFVVASIVLAESKQTAIPETETEAERETDKYICPPSGEPDDPKIPKCEHQSVIDMYHKYLPTLRKVEVWNTARQGYLRQRWREVALELAKEKNIVADDILTWFGDFFQHIGTSKFLTGKVNSKDGRAFTADLEWILKPSNFAKIVEGKYHGVN